MDRVSLVALAHFREVEAPESGMEIWDITTDGSPNF